MVIRRVLVWSLIALLPFAIALAIEGLLIGTEFWFNLWQADRPFAIMLWFGELLFPGWLVYTLYSYESVPRFYISAGLAGAFVSFVLFEALIWKPWAAGGTWGW